MKYVRSRCHYIVHFGNFVVLVSINQTDMLNLRCLALVSTSCSIAFNLLQPTPLITPACWGAFFIACHLYQLSVLLRERQETTLSRREELAYEQAFLRYGFTPRQFVDIVERSSGRWPTFARGEYVHRSGEAMDEIHCLLDGAVEQVSTTGEAFATLHAGKGGWLGEFFDPNQDASYWERPHRFPISYRCVSEGGCATLALARRALHETITTNPRLHAAATRAEVADLWGKIHQDMPELRQRTYSAMLEMATADGVVQPRERELLTDFAARHSISHDEFCANLGRLGWTEGEFEAGRRARAWPWTRRATARSRGSDTPPA